MFSALQNLLNVLPRSKNSDLSLPLPGLQLLNSCALTQLRLGLGSSGVLSPPSSETLVSPADLSGIRIASSRIHLVQPSSAGSPQLPGWQGGRAGCRPTALVLVLETRPRGEFRSLAVPCGFFSPVPSHQPAPTVLCTESVVASGRLCAQACAFVPAAGRGRVAPRKGRRWQCRGRAQSERRGVFVFHRIG